MLEEKTLNLGDEKEGGFCTETKETSMKVFEETDN